VRKRLEHLAEPRVRMLFAHALRGCAAHLPAGTSPAPAPDRFALSALELVVHADEAYGARGRVRGADWLGTRVAVRLLPRGFPPDVRACAVPAPAGG
jgi:hypothetical protein